MVVDVFLVLKVGLVSEMPIVALVSMALKVPMVSKVSIMLMMTPDTQGTYDA